jgi:hypothetical protein
VLQAVSPVLEGDPGGLELAAMSTKSKSEDHPATGQLLQ